VLVEPAIAGGATPWAVTRGTKAGHSTLVKRSLSGVKELDVLIANGLPKFCGRRREGFDSSAGSPRSNWMDIGEPPRSLSDPRIQGSSGKDIWAALLAREE